MNVDKEKWDGIFHNEADPDNCPGRKRPTGCSICDKLITNEKNARETEKS